MEGREAGLDASLGEQVKGEWFTSDLWPGVVLPDRKPHPLDNLPHDNRGGAGAFGWFNEKMGETRDQPAGAPQASHHQRTPQTNHDAGGEDAK